MSEKDLERIKRGDLAPLEKAYLELKPQFMKFAKSKFPEMPVPDLEDVYQETMIALYQNIQRGVLTKITSKISAYVFQIGNNLIMDHKNKQKKEKEFLLNNSRLEEILAQTYNPGIDRAAGFVFSQFSEKCKSILQLFYYEKKSLQEIAELLNYKNADTVKANKSRCIANYSIQTKNIADYESGDE